MDYVEFAPSGGQLAAHPPAEGPRFGKPGRAHQGELGEVDPGLELRWARDAKRVLRPVEVETGYRDPPDAFVENRVRLSGEERVESTPAPIVPEATRSLAAATPPERAPSMGERIVDWRKRLFGR